MNAGSVGQQRVSFGDCVIPKHQILMSKCSGYKHNNSWGKNSFCGGEYGVGAPQTFKPNIKIMKTFMNLKGNLEDGIHNLGQQDNQRLRKINWEILKPIMAFDPM